MATATQFVQYWALAFVSLSVALVLLSLFYRFIDFNLHWHSLRKEALIAGIASVIQGAGFWFSASLFQGNPFRRLVIPGAIMAIVYWLSHLEDWSGYEIGGIALFQGVILVTGLCLMGGQGKMAILILGVFVVGLAFIASIAKSL